MINIILSKNVLSTFNRINFDKTDQSKECEFCNYNYFNNDFKFDSKVCDDCNSVISVFGLKN